eukprot:TRINITY_DN15276_c0_g2_i2.p1 TRINITY_DN15276_c0_g2~~TRINITY_DN15276_c0_g2_i2.p1  ORF type:complete len:629 (-),score=117.05 TRINITY_DN15276_c0_g2_i2:730-2343(-)
MSAPFVASGFFLNECDQPTLPLKCNPPAACMDSPNGRSVCPSLCSEGYTGLGCASCAALHYRLDAACQKCPSQAVQTITMIAIALVLVFIVYRLFNVSTKVPLDVRVTLQAIQTVALYPNITTKWPKSVLTVLQLYSLTNVNIELFAPECVVSLGYWDKYYVKVFGPFFLVAFVIILKVLRNIALRLRGAPDHQTLAKDLAESSTGMLLFVAVTLYTSSVSITFTPFNCEPQPNGSFTLIKDSSVICFDEGWRSHLGVVVFAILVYPIGVPCSLIFIFLKNRLNFSSAAFLKKYDALVSPYRHPCLFWELVVMLKRTFFVLSSDFLGGSTYSVKYGVSILVMISFCWLDMLFSPYSQHSANILNDTWNLICIIVLLCQGLVFESNGNNQDLFTLFGALVVVLLVMCLSYTICQLLCAVIKRDMEKLSLPASATSHLPQEIFVEVCQIHSHSLLEKRGELEINIKEILQLSSNSAQNPFLLENAAIRKFLKAEAQSMWSNPDLTRHLSSGGLLDLNIVSGQPPYQRKSTVESTPEFSI